MREPSLVLIQAIPACVRIRLPRHSPCFPTTMISIKATNSNSTTPKLERIPFFNFQLSAHSFARSSWISQFLHSIHTIPIVILAV